MSLAERRRSSPTKTKGRGGSAVETPSSPDLHRSQSHEPRNTPPLFLMPSTADRSAPVTVPVREIPDTTDYPSSSSSRLSYPGKATMMKEINSDDKETDNLIRRSTSSAGREAVVQLNYGGTTAVVVDGGKRISGGGGGDGGDPGCQVGMSGRQDGGHGGGWSWRCPSPLFLLSSCYAAWLAGIELVQEFVHGLLSTHVRLIKSILLALVLVGFAVYLIVAIWKTGLCAIAVIIIALLAVLIQSLRLLKRFCGGPIDTYVISPVRQVRHSRPCVVLKW